MVSYTIFYSWQSDYDYSTIELEDKETHKNSNGTLDKPLSQKEQIKKILDWQAYSLGKKLKCNITVDMDTDETPGMQPISDVVIKKIKNCHMFVCDLTPVTHINGADGKRNKLMPNSNVMFELGIAISYLQPYQIIAIAHKNNGNWIISELPLDISHRKILTFENTADLDLKLFPALESSLRHYQSLEGKWARLRNKFTNMFKSSPSKENDDQREQNAHNNSDVFFYEKMASTFPGFRGLKMVNYKEFCTFFNNLIPNEESPMLLIDKYGRYPIKQFSELQDSIFLIGNTEVSCYLLSNSNSTSDVFVYRHPENQKLQFIYINSRPQIPVQDNIKIIIKEKTNNLNSYNKQEVLEYVENKMDGITMSKERYEDILIGEKKDLSLSGRFELRRMYLSESKLMIVPNYSIFNEEIYDPIVNIFSCYNNENDLENKLYELFQAVFSTKNKV